MPDFTFFACWRIDRKIQLGFGIASPALHRFWTMLSHYHGQIWNGSEIAASLGIAPNTARRYLDVLTQTFMVRQLQPWYENVGKRVVIN